MIFGMEVYIIDIQWGYFFFSTKWKRRVVCVSLTIDRRLKQILHSSIKPILSNLHSEEDSEDCIADIIDCRVDKCQMNAIS